MREMRRISDGNNTKNGMGMWVQRISVGARNLGGNTKNVGNKGGDAGNQGGKLSIAVEITWNSNGNDKLKSWREVKIINLASRI